MDKHILLVFLVLILVGLLAFVANMPHGNLSGMLLWLLIVMIPATIFVLVIGYVCDRKR
jgi:hypothetical protein